MSKLTQQIVKFDSLQRRVREFFNIKTPSDGDNIYSFIYLKIINQSATLCQKCNCEQEDTVLDFAEVWVE